VDGFVQEKLSLDSRPVLGIFKPAEHEATRVAASIDHGQGEAPSMRTFRIGDGEGRKSVSLDVQGSRLVVTKGNADGTTQRVGKDFPGEAEALARSEEMALDLAARGYVERNSHAPAKAGPARSASSSKPRKPASGGSVLGLLAEAGEDDAEPVESLLPRFAPSPAAEVAPKKKPAGKKKKKRRKGEGGGDELDKRVVAGMGAFGVLCLAFVGYLAYSAFLKPPSIVGHWEGSRTEHEIGKYLTNTQYQLILDDKKNASMAVQGGPPSAGTYALQGDRLKLTLKDEEGEAAEVQYKVALGGSTLDLFDPESGKKVVQLIRFHERTAAGRAPAAPAAAPKDLAGAPADKAADAALVSIPFGAKDNAFALRYPAGWEMEDGARPDNSYSWVRLTRGSAKIQVFADVAGSLTSGPNSGQYEEGSPMAPVHGAHERYKRTASELYPDYKESEPAPFQGSGMGEGRVATFTASGGGMFGSKLSGLRVTLLTNDRRISILCEAPPKEFEKLKPTFLALCRSLSR
jgi:predicted DNA-binding WGR domain protein